MEITGNRKRTYCLVFSVVLTVHLCLNITAAETNAVSPSIELQDFRWNIFPLTVLVELNEWSVDDYAFAVRKALDTWMNSIWNYTQTYTNTTLALTYQFYVSTVNASDNYDVRITFSQHEIERDIVGLTTLRWNDRTHEPITPFSITITSYSATAENRFITNVAMHELGHVLGLGHAESPDTTNGPELMYRTSSHEQTVYPSTLNIYGLVRLYSDNFGETVVLPSTIPYVMVAHDSRPPQDHVVAPNILDRLLTDLAVFFDNPQEILDKPRLLLVPGVLWTAIAVILGLLLRSTTKATMGSLGVLIVVYYVVMSNIDLVVFGLTAAFLLPSMLLGAVIGGVINRQITDRRISQ